MFSDIKKVSEKIKAFLDSDQTLNDDHLKKQYIYFKKFLRHFEEAIDEVKYSKKDPEANNLEKNENLEENIDFLDLNVNDESRKVLNEEIDLLDMDVDEKVLKEKENSSNQVVYENKGNKEGQKYLENLKK